MVFAVSILAVLVLFFLAGALPVDGVQPTVVFRTPVFMLLLALLCGSCLIATLRGGRWRKPGFLLCHLGVVLVCLGAFAGQVWGDRARFRTPVDEHFDTPELPREDGTQIPLGFRLAVIDAKADYYPPKFYGMYAPPDYNLVREVAIRTDGTLDLPGELQPDSGLLRGEGGTWARQVVLADGSLLQVVPPTVKYYEATLRFLHDDRPSDTRVLVVNHPVTYRGWRFYLMDYQTEPYLAVSLAARRDPGRRLAILGIWCLILGTAWICWQPRRARA